MKGGVNSMVWILLLVACQAGNDPVAQTPNPSPPGGPASSNCTATPASRAGVTKILFVGDDAQLPPVGDDKDSPALSSDDTYILTEMIRQDNTNPLAYL